MALIHGLRTDNLRGELFDEERALLDRHGDRLVLFHIDGPISFGAVKELTLRLTSRAAYEVMALDLTDVPIIDSSVAMAIEDVIEQTRKQGHRLLLAGLSPQIRRMLNRLGALRTLDPLRPEQPPNRAGETGRMAARRQHDPR